MHLSGSLYCRVHVPRPIEADRSGSKQLRLVEFSSEFVEPHWCEKGHIGLVLSGTLEVDCQIAVPSGGAIGPRSAALIMLVNRCARQLIELERTQQGTIA
jgi:hypothetical protein